MNLKSLLRQVFPPPRRALTWGSGVPLAVFALLMGLVVFSVVPSVVLNADRPSRWGSLSWLGFGWLSGIGVPFPRFEVIRALQFTRPWAFLLLLFAPWIWWMQSAGHSGLPQRRGAWAVFIRLTICGLLVLVLAEPRAVRTSDRVAVVYDVDISDSVSPWRGEALDFVAASAAEKPGADEAGLVVFGRTPAVEYPPRATFPFEKYVNSQVSGDATNLEQSLALSAAMLPEEHTGRIVLVSDGTETEGKLKDVLSDLQARGVQVNVVPMDYVYENEVLLERLDLPRLVRLGETTEASVVLTSLKAGRGSLVLRQGDQEISREEVEFAAGKSRFKIPILVTEPGYYEYAARIEIAPDLDNRAENNEVRNYLYLEGPGRVLLVTGDGGTGEFRFLQQALAQGERQVDVRSALEFPYDPLELMPYDAVIFADVSADLLLATQIQAMHDAIRNLGVGFLMVGGPGSFGPGGWQGSPVADALPVSLKITNKKILPKGAIAIILHTCEFPQGNSWAKRITKRAIQVLNPQDLVGVLAQTMNGDEWVFDLTPASEYPQLVPVINNAQIGDMGTFGTTMQLGLKSLVESDAASRHMIIISDGDAQAPTPGLLQEFIDNQISVSTVAVFPHNGDVSTLQQIAGLTKGRFYYPSDPNQLPSIFVKEARTLRRSQLQIRSFVPDVTGVDTVLRGITESPELHGYVLTSPREDPQAVVVLSAPQTESEAAAGEEEQDPILAIWRYGLGVSAAWTSDLTDRWARDWVEWERFQPFVNQLLTRISRTRREQFLRIYTYVNGGEGVVVVEDFHPEETLLDMAVSVTGPNGYEETRAIRQIAPRRYQVSMPLKGEGRYQVMVSASDGTREESAYAGFIVSYSPEYLRFRADPIVLQEIAEATGGKVWEIESDPEEIGKALFGERVQKQTSRPIFDWYLILLACLIPIDVGIRRVQLDFNWLRRLRRGERAQTTQTLGTLLERTGELRGGRARPVENSSETATTSGGFRSMAASGRSPGSSGNPGASSRQSGQLTQAAPPGAAEPAPEQSGGTTSRLLAMKRKRAQEQQQDGET